MDEDWNVLKTFFPKQWQELAVSTGALKGLRQDKSASNLLRILLIHIACGYSLRETVVRARKENLADLSDVALLKRLRKCKEWLYSMCVHLFNERGLDLGDREGIQFRLFDATIVKEPGKTGSQWRVHYSVRVPSLACDFFKVTATQGSGTGESLTQYPINSGDYIIADRGYSTASGIHYATSHNAFVCIRANMQNIVLLDTEEKHFKPIDYLHDITVSGTVASWDVLIPCPNKTPVPARICAIRRSEEAIRIVHKKLKQKSLKLQRKLKDDTFFLSEYVIVLTTLPESFSPSEVLEWYRIRWQIELVFKRFKQIAQLGHLPKYDDESAKAWLYGKLLTALLAEKIINHASSISPWGYELEQGQTSKSMA